MAAKAFRDGLASEGQQRLLFAWLMFDAAHIRDISFDPEPSGRVTAFNEGQRSVGRQLALLADMPPDQIERIKDDG